MSLIKEVPFIERSTYTQLYIFGTYVIYIIERLSLQGVPVNGGSTVYKIVFFRQFTKDYYNKKSMAEGGTLLQLQYLINRSNVPSKVKKDVNAAQDFFETVVIAHVVAAAMQFLT